MKGNEIREADGAMQRVSAGHAQASGSDCTCSGSHWKAVSGREGRADCGQRTSVAAGGVKETWREPLLTWSQPWQWVKRTVVGFVWFCSR